MVRVKDTFMSSVRYELWVKLQVSLLRAGESLSKCPGIRYAKAYECPEVFDILLYGLNEEDRTTRVRRLKYFKMPDGNIIWGVRCSQKKDSSTKEPILVVALIKVGVVGHCQRCDADGRRLYWTGTDDRRKVKCSSCHRISHNPDH